MRFTLGNLINSIAGQVKEIWPEIPVYSNPNQQGTKPPCFFIFFMPTDMESRMGRRMQKNIGIDLVYITKRNLPNAYDSMVSVADVLDYKMEFVEYVENKEKQKLRALEREWKIDDGELHYQFYIKPIVSVAETIPWIEEIEKLEEKIGDGIYR